SLMTGPGTNTYLVGKKNPLLIDTGSGLPEYTNLLREVLREKGVPEISRVLVTHGHPDHAGGLEVLRREFPALTVRKMVRSGEEIGPIAFLKDGDRVEVDGCTLTAIHTPGHAIDHLCFHLEEELSLFTGDLIVGVGTVVIHREAGGLKQYIASLERLLSLELERLYPGHGPVIHRPREKIVEYIEHRRMREEQILEALARGDTTIPEIVSRVYTDVIPPLHPVAERSVEAHLSKLEEDHLVERWTEEGQNHYRLLSLEIG
ncbi:MAG: MBL fold metallo-hydrolase, partial [Candidatus Tectomicrobia bacterium]|nr:MBL fold metallo-hydrolase [Candidatus Tectomicrobia bacterium]